VLACLKGAENQGAMSGHIDRDSNDVDGLVLEQGSRIRAARDAECLGSGVGRSLVMRRNRGQFQAFQTLHCGHV
jgi:hypothetical protein